MSSTDVGNPRSRETLGEAEPPPAVTRTGVPRARVVRPASGTPYKAARIWLRRLTIWPSWPSRLPPLSRLAMEQSRLPSRLPGPDSAVKLMWMRSTCSLRPSRFRSIGPMTRLSSWQLAWAWTPACAPTREQPRNFDGHRLGLGDPLAALLTLFGDLAGDLDHGHDAITLLLEFLDAERAAEALILVASGEANVLQLTGGDALALGRRLGQADGGDQRAGGTNPEQPEQTAARRRVGQMPTQRLDTILVAPTTPATQGPSSRPPW